MKQFYGLLLALLCSAGLYSQTTITGTIVDADGFPLVGATVTAKGTSVGTVADFDGNFSLTAPEEVTTLVFSYTGYETQEVTLGTETNIEVTMAEGVALDEIVVTGYSVTTKRQTTGAVSTVSTEELSLVPSGNVEQQLQGRAPGVTVITNGQPGTSSIVRVRGFGSFGDNRPLYVVDGVPTDNIDFVNPDDIEATSVLKDAASASIYGARAANGVIVIQTRRGKNTPQPLSIVYDGLVGFTSPGNGPEVLSPEQDAQKVWEGLFNDGLLPGDEGFSHDQYGDGPTPVIPDYIMVGNEFGVNGEVNIEDFRDQYNIDPSAGALFQIMRANREGTDWYDAITRTGTIQRHTLGLSGSTDQVRYYISGHGQVQEGILLNNDFERYGLRVNTEFKIGNRIRFGENLQFTHRRTLGQTGGGGGAGLADDENDFNLAYRMHPLIPILDEFGGYAGTRASGFNNPRNPVAGREGLANNRSFTNAAFGNVYLEVDPITDVTLRSSFGGSYFAFTGRNYNRVTYENSENNSSFSYNEFQGYGTNWVWTNTVRYDPSFGQNNFNVLAGVESIENGRGRSSSSSGTNPFSQDLNFVNINNVNNRLTFGGFGNGQRFYSLFAKVDYNFNERYYLTAVVRRDGSSSFGTNNRYGTFPAFSAAWRLTAEPFMANQTLFTDLKVRGGWGQMGNSRNVSGDNRFSLFASSVGAAGYDINGNNSAAVAGIFPSRLGTEDARWEAAETVNVGIDATLFNGRIDFVADLWRKTTDGLLVQIPLPAVAGEATPPTRNVGTMRNQGLDMLLTYRGDAGSKFSYEVSVNGSFLQNEILEYAEGIDFFDRFGSRIAGPVVRNEVGRPLASFFGYRVIGLFQSQEEIANAPTQAGAAPGRFRIEDNNGRDENGELTGVPDGIIDEADRTFLGSAVPDFTGGVNIRLQYGQFDLNTFLYASIGNEIYNNSRWFTDFGGSFRGAAISTRTLDSWTPQNPNATVPLYESASNLSTNQESLSYYVEDGSYLRMVNLSLGYTLPDGLLGNTLNNLRVSVAANNLFTISDYEGLDPAVGGDADVDFGIDVGNYPVTRSFNLRLTAGF